MKSRRHHNNRGDERVKRDLHLGPIHDIALKITGRPIEKGKPRKGGDRRVR